MKPLHYFLTLQSNQSVLLELRVARTDAYVFKSIDRVCVVVVHLSVVEHLLHTLGCHVHVFSRRELGTSLVETGLSFLPCLLVLNVLVPGGLGVRPGNVVLRRRLREAHDRSLYRLSYWIRMRERLLRLRRPGLLLLLAVNVPHFLCRLFVLNLQVVGS